MKHPPHPKPLNNFARYLPKDFVSGVQGHGHARALSPKKAAGGASQAQAQPSPKNAKAKRSPKSPRRAAKRKELKTEQPTRR